MDNFETSASVQNISAKLLKLQSNNLTVYKTSTNPFFKSKYANLGEYLDVIIPSAFEVGLSVNSFVAGNYLILQIADPDSGEFIRSGYPLAFAGKTAQEYAGQITYARRYSLGAAFNINAEDDDGNVVSGKVAAPVTAKSAVQKPWLNLDSKTSVDIANVQLVKKNIESGTWTSLTDVRSQFAISNEVAEKIKTQYPNIK